MTGKKSVKGYLSYSSIYFFYFFAMAVFGSMLSVYLSGNGKTTVEISLIVSASGLFTMIAQPFLGILYDRTGWRKKLSVILLILSAATGVIFGFTQNTGLLFFLNGLSMAFLNSVNPICEQLASSSPYRYGVLRLWGAVGYAVGTQVAGMVLDSGASILLFILFAVTAGITCLGFHFAGLKDTSPAEKQVENQPRKKAALTLPLILFAIFCFFFSGLTGAAGTYVPMFLQERLGTSLAGTILFMGTLMEIPIIFLSDRFMDRLNGQQLLALNTLLLAVQTAAYSFSPSNILVCAVLILTKSVTTMLFIMVTLKVVMTLTGGQYATTALSVIATVKSLGSVVLTNLTGQVAETVQVEGIFPIFFWASLALLAFSFLIRIPDDKKRYFAGDG